MSFATIIQKYRLLSHSKREQGNKFERLMKAFLLTYPKYKWTIKDVWLWNEFPSRTEISTGMDIGIDLVARTNDGEYWAIQCKCFGEDKAIDLKDVSTFLSTSNIAFKDIDQPEQIVHFSRRLWLDTSGKGFTLNAQLVMDKQDPPVMRMGFYDLAEAPVNWDALDNGIFGQKAESPKYEIRPHQQDAIDKTHEYFKTHDRGKLIMACGTGKTFTALKIAEKETESAASPIVLFLAPSIALVGQTLNEWTAQVSLGKSIYGICICSDPSVSSKIKENDEVGESVSELALPASTSCSEIEWRIRDARLEQAKKGGMIVVFSTYQSISVVASVQQRFSDGLPFDLCVCDEAHRTTGVTRKDEDASEFVKVHDNNIIHAKKRLYMTATPRLYSATDVKKANKAEAMVWTMDDPLIYGEEIYRIGFGKAVQLGLLSDYKVLVLTLNEDEMSTELQNHINSKDAEIPADDSLKLIGCINALSKITKDTKLLNDVDPGLMHNAIAFCQNIKISEKTSDTMNKCNAAYYETLTPEERARVVSIKAEHVDGSMGASARAGKLQWLRNVDRESNSCHILTNVRCLSEGVDVPSLDAVLFLSARNSEIDVVQSVGRVMRRAPRKKYGYIIIPVVIPSGVEPDKALDDNKRFGVVWTVLQALRAHDDRFNATVNKIELNKKRPSQILIGGVVNIHDADESGDGMDDAFRQKEQKQLSFNFENMQNAVYSKLVQKVGDRRYWEQWAADVADIAERHITQIKKLISEDGSQAQKDFQRYVKGLRKNINPSVTDDDAIEMLAQHFITQPVFAALFQNYSFVQNNAVSESMQGMVTILNKQTPKEDNEKLERFYESVRERAKGIDNAEGKQKVIVELYDKFFKTAFPKTVEKLGIVYTPVEVVDFIINSVEDVMKKEFGRSLSDENVHILDPFTGTGTFIVRLLQSGIIKPEDMARKYKNELHACEIVLLAYYIASINIENAYHDFIAEQMSSEDVDDKYEFEQVADQDNEIAFPQKKIKYEPFEGICMTDTFQMGEDNSVLTEEVFPQNSKRVNKLKKTPITVFMGNPPYSVGASDGDGTAQNESYPNLEARIGETYMANSSSKGLRSLFDSYIKAFRWSSDKLLVRDSMSRIVDSRDGIIAFVTNVGWLDGNAMDGMRKCFEREFSNIYVFNLRGNCRTSGELRRKEGGNVFGLGSRTPIAITILVKKQGFSGRAKIMYKAVDDYLTREQKLELCEEYHSVLDKKFKASVLTPDEHGGWIRKKSDKFGSFIPLADKDKKNTKTFFQIYSGGLFTSRDSWCYNFSEEKVKSNIKRLIDNYNSELKAYAESGADCDPKKFVNLDPTVGSWTRAMYSAFSAGRVKTYDEKDCAVSDYRPFTKVNSYFANTVNECSYKLHDLFVSQPNLVITTSGTSGKRNHSTLIATNVPDLHLNGDTQCFPLYWYSEDKDVDYGQIALFGNEITYSRHDGITDFILDQAQQKYGPRVTKEDIFYYVYGSLHSKSYIEKFADDLKMQLPRLPLVTEPQKFWAFSKAGRQLADLHLNYETVPAHPDVVVEGDKGNYQVVKMQPNKGKSDFIIYNDDITVKNIPMKAYDYVVNGKSVIEWIKERYQVKTDKDSGITNDPNDWGKEHGNPRYILDLLLSVINVSCQTVDIVNSLPEVDWDKE